MARVAVGRLQVDVVGAAAVLPKPRLRRWLSFWINGGEFGDDGAE